jgi:hypothetical protein
MNYLVGSILIGGTALALTSADGGIAAESAAFRPAAAEAGIAPPPDARWQYQLQARHEGNRRSGGIDVNVCSAPLGGGNCVRPRVIDFDPFLDEKGDDVDSKPNRAGVRALHRAGGYAICYVDAGGIENYRPDYPRFVRWHRRHGRSLLGKPFSRRFPEERWANIGGARQRAFLLRMMERRTRLCSHAGFDAIEYDVVEAWSSGRKVTGWKVGYRDQIVYNRGLARIAHRHGLAVGLKNDLEQVEDLVGRFDFAINEECFTYDECDRLTAFIDAGKPVFHVEYTNARPEFCPATEALGFNSIRKSSSYSLYAKPFRPCS